MSNILYKKMEIRQLYNIIFLFFLSAIYTNNEYRAVFEVLFYLVFFLYSTMKRKKITYYFVWSAMVIGFSFLSLQWSSDTQNSLFNIRLLIQMGIMGNLIISYIDTKEKIFEVYNLFIISGIVLILYLLVKLSPLELITTRLGGTHRVGINSNVIGTYFAISSIFSYYFSKVKSKKYLYLFLTLVFSIFVFLSGARQAILFLLLGLISILFLLSKNPVQVLKNTIMGVILIVVSYFIIMNNVYLYNIVGFRIDLLISSVLTGAEADGSSVMRAKMIETGITLIKQRPLLGHGIGSFARISGWNVYAHNNYIELLVGIGVIGTSLYYSIYVVLLLGMRKLRKNLTVTPLITIMAIFPIIDIAFVSYNTFMWQVIISLSYAVYKYENNNRRL